VEAATTPSPSTRPEAPERQGGAVVANGSLTPADVAGKDRHAGGHPDASPQAVPRLREARSVSTYDLCGVHCPPHRYGDAAKRKHYRNETRSLDGQIQKSGFLHRRYQQPVEWPMLSSRPL
jgi:hypothetical protein